MSARNADRHALRALLAATVLAAACRDEPSPVGPAPQPEGPALQRAQGAPSAGRVAPDPQAALARDIPGFGGFFLDPATGAPTVYLTDVRQRGAAERALAQTLGEHGATPAQLRVVQGDYDYQQLDGWLDQMASDALAVPGVVYVDLDEGRNRLRVGIETPGADAPVRGVAARHNVPSAAVATVAAEPIAFTGSLTGAASPERGGIQIQSAVGICTLGFNTWPVGSWYRFFVTASHCTKTRSVVDGTQFYQPNSFSASNFIGTEVSDPPFFTYFPCPAGRKCRWSDVARVRYSSGPSVDLGGIARTTGYGSLTINALNPVFNITAEKSAPTLYSVAHKIGRTTGWTKGIVVNTCTAVNVAYTNITLFCQDLVYAPSGPGDSGSPVFAWSGSGSNVTLLGILWGGNGSTFAFSRMSGIEGELGALTTF
jgi:hypothetical protein